MWLGDAPKRKYNADRFFRFRKYWDYSGGIATDLFYHVVAPLNICWGEAQFPYRVTGTGGIYVFKDEREVPDTFTLTADFAKGHSLVLSSSMGNETHIPGLIRGHEGTIMIVPHGRFEGTVEQITVTPSRFFRKEFEEKHGSAEVVFKCEAARIAHGEFSPVRTDARDARARRAHGVQGNGDYRHERRVLPRGARAVLRRAQTESSS